MALCAGIAGIEIGLRIASGRRYRTVCYVEREAHAAACLVARMEDEALDPAPVWDDIATFDGGPWRGRVDIITAGFPCQPWSVAGKKLGRSDPRWPVFPHILRIVSEVRPGLVFFENVPGLDVWGVRAALRVLGYRSKAIRLQAADVGAPHKRERVYILAYSDRSRLDRHPQRDRGQDARKKIPEGRDTERYDLFPPGRDAPPMAWKNWPSDAQPPILRGLDGTALGVDLSERADRLRRAGNAVVPLAAAYAFCALGTLTGLRNTIQQTKG